MTTPYNPSETIYAIPAYLEVASEVERLCQMFCRTHGKQRIANNIFKLEQLQAFSRTLPQERVNMNHWRSRNGEYAHVEDCQLGTECGTAACILGWMTADAFYKSEGWSAKHWTLTNNTTVRLQRGMDDDVWENYHAAAIYFDLPIGIAMWLFDPPTTEEAENKADLDIFQDRLQVVLTAMQDTYNKLN